MSFERQVAGMPEVVEAHRLSGDPDFLLRVAVADLAAYERFYSEALSGLPGVAQVTSHVAMKAIKPDTGLPVTP
ncbi:Lrp/AsnC ligand binding domain-containing protein [Nonomuraea sp. 3N208]|uniref:Lrp/AsnC ligand binding domain-containing protein n=1 Tax=Nonomuraea sp. 3N208 TaxID=3457421 RepID=UPI003FCF423C